jgi:hypothetical protein
MKLKKMFDSLKNCKPHRNEYVIKWDINFDVDDYSYIFAFLPTIIWQPWTFRYPGASVISIMWLNFNIGIGEWKRREKE